MMGLIGDALKMIGLIGLTIGFALTGEHIAMCLCLICTEMAYKNMD
jgi:hypothetical protein